MDPVDFMMRGTSPKVSAEELEAYAAREAKQQIRPKTEVDEVAVGLRYGRRVEELMSSGVPEKEAREQARQEETSLTTQPGRYTTPGEEGIGRIAARQVVKGVSKVAGEGVTTSLARAIGIPARLGGPDPEAPRFGAESERKESEERQSPEVAFMNRPSLLDVPEKPMEPKFGLPEEGGPKKGEERPTFRTVTMPKEEREKAQSAFDASIRKIDMDYYTGRQKVFKAKQAGRIDQKGLEAAQAAWDAWRKTEKEKISKEGVEPSVLRELTGIYQPPSTTLKNIAEGKEGWEDLLPPVRIAKGYYKAAKAGVQEAKDIAKSAGEIAKELEPTYDPDAPAALGGEFIEKAGTAALGRVMQGMTAAEKPLAGPERGISVEAPLPQVLKVAGTALTAPWTVKYGRSLAREGLSERELTPVGSKEPVKKGEEGEIPGRVLSAVGHMIDPTELATRAYWYDVANTVSSGLGLFDEHQSLVRALPIDPRGTLAKTLVGTGLAADVLVPFEEMTLGVTGGLGRGAARAYRAGKTVGKMGGTVEDVARASVAASGIPGSSLATKGTDAHAVLTETMMNAAKNRAQKTGHVPKSREVATAVNQYVVAAGGDAARAEQAWVDRVGGPDRLGGPERARVEQELKAVGSSIGRSEGEVAAAMGVLEGAANRAVQTGRITDADEFYRDISFGREQAWDPSRAAMGQALFQTGPARKAYEAAEKAEMDGLYNQGLEIIKEMPFAYQTVAKVYLDGMLDATQRASGGGFSRPIRDGNIVDDVYGDPWGSHRMGGDRGVARDGRFDALNPVRDRLAEIAESRFYRENERWPRRIYDGKETTGIEVVSIADKANAAASKIIADTRAKAEGILQSAVERGEIDQKSANAVLAKLDPEATAGFIPHTRREQFEVGGQDLTTTEYDKDYLRGRLPFRRTPTEALKEIPDDATILYWPLSELFHNARKEIERVYDDAFENFDVTSYEQAKKNIGDLLAEERKSWPKEHAKAYTSVQDYLFERKKLAKLQSEGKITPTERAKRLRTYEEGMTDEDVLAWLWFNGQDAVHAGEVAPKGALPLPEQWKSALPGVEWVTERKGRSQMNLLREKLGKELFKAVESNDPRVLFQTGVLPAKAETVAPGISRLHEAMVAAASEDTAFDAARYAANKGKDALAEHCKAVARVVREKYGGDILTGKVEGQTHFWNRLADGTEIDLTSRQFGGNGFDPVAKGGKVTKEAKTVNPRFRAFEERVGSSVLFQRSGQPPIESAIEAVYARNPGKSLLPSEIIAEVQNTPSWRRVDPSTKARFLKAMGEAPVRRLPLDNAKPIGTRLWQTVKLETAGGPTVTDIATLLGNPQELPRHLKAVSDFIMRQRQKLLTGTMTNRDTAKAMAMTLGSIHSQAHSLEETLKSLRAGGMDAVADIIEGKFPERFSGQFGVEDFISPNATGKPMVRPESAVAAWFLTENGQKALDAIEKGVVVPEWEELVRVRSLFGSTKTTLGRMLVPDGVYGLHNIQKFTDEVNAARGQVKALDDAIMKVGGVGQAKVGFLGHMIGFGNYPTMDVRIIKAFLKPEEAGVAFRLPSSAVDDIVEAVRHGKNPEASAALRSRLEGLYKQTRDYLKLDVPDEAVGEVIHHWLWDRIGRTTTEHQDLLKVMEHAQTGPGGVIRGATYRSASTGKLIADVYATGDFGTLLHENGHLLHVLFPDDGATWQKMLDVYGENGQFTVNSAERFADDMGALMKERAAKINPKVRGILESIRDFFLDAWAKIRGTQQASTIPPATRQMFDTWWKAREQAPRRTGAPERVVVSAPGPKAQQPPVIHRQAGGPNPYTSENVKETNRVKMRDLDIAAELGVRPGETVDLADLYEHALRAAYANEVRHKWPVEMVRITTRTMIPTTRLGSVNKMRTKVMESALGTSIRDFAKSAKVVGDEHRLIMTPVQSAGMRQLAQEIDAWGYGRFVPERLQEPGADWSYVTPKEFNAIHEAITDLMAGPATKRDRAVESLPMNFLTSVVDSLFHSQRWIPGTPAGEGSIRKLFPQVIRNVEKTFTKENPFRRLDPIADEIINKHIRKMAAAGDEFLYNMRRVNAELRGAKSLPGKVAWFFRGHPEIVLEMARPLAPPIVYDDIAKAAFAPVEQSIQTPSGPMRPGGTPKDYAAHAKMQARDVRPRVLKDPQQRSQWISSLEAVFLDPRRSMSAPLDSERRALARLRAGVEHNSDVTVVIAGLYRRRKAMADRGSQIMVTFAGSSEGVISGLPMQRKIDVYEHFYAGDFDWIAETMKTNELRVVGDPGKKVIKPIDTAPALISLIAQSYVDRAVTDLFQDLWRHNMVVNRETMWADRLKKRATGIDTRRREVRMEEHLARLGYTPDQYNEVFKAYQFEVKGPSDALNTNGWRDLVHAVDGIERKRRRTPNQLTPDEVKTENALHVFSQALPRRFTTKAQADAAVTRMKAWLQQAGMDESVIRGPVPEFSAMDDWSHEVIEAVNAIYNANDGVRKTEWLDGKYPTYSSGQVVNPDAWVQAHEFMDAFGIHPANKTDILPSDLADLSPTGEQAVFPAAAVEAIKTVMLESAPPGVNFSSAGLGDRIIHALGMSTKSGIFSQLFTNTAAFMKMGMTCGGLIPILPFYASQAIGNQFYAYMHKGVVGTTRQTFFAARNADVVADAVLAITNGAPARAKLASFATEDGRIYTAQEVADLASHHGLNSQFVKGEFISALDAEVQRYLSTFSKWRDRMTLGGYRRALVEGSGYVDNVSRMITFVDELRMGKSPDQAAEIARRINLDYTQLSEVERTYLRNMVLFYAYTRRNIANIWWALLHNPSRVLGQIRLARGLNKAIFDEDYSVITNDESTGRISVAFKPSARVGMSATRWVLPQQSAVDFFAVPTEILTVGHTTSTEKLLGRLHPALQIGMQYAFQKIPSVGADASDPRVNKVPAFFIAYDNALGGGVMQRMLDIRPHEELDTWDSTDSANRYETVYAAGNWVGWQLLTKGLGIERTLDELSIIDRMDTGIIEAPIPGGANRGDMGPMLARPRVGLTPFTEGAALAGFRPNFAPDAETLESEQSAYINRKMQEEQKLEGKKLK